MIRYLKSAPKPSMPPQKQCHLLSSPLKRHPHRHTKHPVSSPGMFPLKRHNLLSSRPLKDLPRQTGHPVPGPCKLPLRHTLPHVTTKMSSRPKSLLPSYHNNVTTKPSPNNGNKPLAGKLTSRDCLPNARPHCRQRKERFWTSRLLTLLPVPLGEHLR